MADAKALGSPLIDDPQDDVDKKTRSSSIDDKASRGLAAAGGGGGDDDDEDHAVGDPVLSRWWVLILFMLLAVCQGASWNLFAPVADTLKEAWPWMNDSFIKNNVNLANVSFLLALQPTSVAIDHYGVRRVTLFASTTMMVSCLLRCVSGVSSSGVVFFHISSGYSRAWPGKAGSSSSPDS